MSVFSDLANRDRLNFTNWWAGDVNNDWLHNFYPQDAEFRAKYSNPDDYARAVTENMLQSTDAYRKTTPGYSQFLLQEAPNAYMQQQMMELGGKSTTGYQPNYFPEYLKSWMAPNYYPDIYQGRNNAWQEPRSSMGFGGLPSEAMGDVWSGFVDKYNQMLGGDTSQQYLSSLTPQQLSKFHELARRSTYSPFGQQLMGRYWDQAYNAWSNFTKATPWLSFLQTTSPTGTSYGL